jgi:hypothetical protein
MGQTTGIIPEILTKVNYCEFCDKLSTSENVCDIYTIEKFEAGDQADLSKNVIVLCPACKKNYDESVFSKKHLKACIMLRDQGLSEWLSDLFERYDISFKQSPADQGFFDRVRYRLVNDQNFIDNTIFLFGAFIIIIGILLFAYGFNNIRNYESDPALSIASDAGQYAPEYLFNLFLELAGVVSALLGLFFELGQVKGNAKANYH